MSMVMNHQFLEGTDDGILSHRLKRGFFMSHAQGSGGTQTRELVRRLKKAVPNLKDAIWLDVDEKPTVDAMKKGVQEHDCFIMFMTRGSLRRWFCQLEIREALATGRKIMYVLFSFLFLLCSSSFLLSCLLFMIYLDISVASLCAPNHSQKHKSHRQHG